MQEPLKVAPQQVEAQVEPDQSTIRFQVPPFSISILSVSLQ